MVADGWRPRLVALDIDGTVVDHDGLLPDAVRQAVGRVLAAGVPVVLATGRSWHGTEPVFTELGLPPGPAVSSNGAVTVTYPPLQITSRVTFDPSAFRKSRVLQTRNMTTRGRGEAGLVFSKAAAAERVPGVAFSPQGRRRRQPDEGCGAPARSG